MKLKKIMKKLTMRLALMLMATSSIVALRQRVYAESDVHLISGSGSDALTMLKPAWIDKNNNGIADQLDNEIVERIANGTSQNDASVIVSLVSAPTDVDIGAFALAGGWHERYAFCFARVKFSLRFCDRFIW